MPHAKLARKATIGVFDSPKSMEKARESQVLPEIGPPVLGGKMPIISMLGILLGLVWRNFAWKS